MDQSGRPNLDAKPMAQIFPLSAIRAKGGKCTTCDCNIPLDGSGFKDNLSRKEYYISGMCQACQDETFAEPEDEDLE